MKYDRLREFVSMIYGHEGEFTAAEEKARVEHCRSKPTYWNLVADEVRLAFADESFSWEEFLVSTLAYPEPGGEAPARAYATEILWDVFFPD